jgi:hypothetical protein
VKLEQASKVTMWTPTRPDNGCVMYKPVKDTIGQRGIADLFVPA